MFTLKLYQNGPLPPHGRTVIMEVAGVWVDYCTGGLKHIRAFKKTVGVEDEGGTFECYIGGEEPKEADSMSKFTPEVVIRGPGGNHYGWGVMENAQGKTTEVFR